MGEHIMVWGTIEYATLVVCFIYLLVDFIRAIVRGEVLEEKEEKEKGK